MSYHYQCTNQVLKMYIRILTSFQTYKKEIDEYGLIFYQFFRKSDFAKLATSQETKADTVELKYSLDQQNLSALFKLD